MIKGKRKEKNNGITLIALIITIIVLLILAGITIGLLVSKNGILGRATDSKTNTEIGEEKEIISFSSMQMASMETIEEKERLTHDEMDKIIDNNSRGLKYELYDDDDGYIVEFTQRKRYYKIYDNGETEEANIEVDNSPGNITEDKNGNSLNGETSPFEIWSIEDLIEFTKSINNGNTYEGKTIRIMKNLDFKSKLSYRNSSSTTYDTYLGGDGTIELKTQLSEEGLGLKSVNKSFKGTLEGQNKTIKGMYINTTIATSGALCGTNNGTIQNLKLEDFNINIGNQSGMICASNKGTIQNIIISGKVKNIATSGGTIELGSVCNSNTGSILYVSNYASVTGRGGLRRVGGICAANSGTIEKCINYGKVSKGYENAGISGTNNNAGIIRECINLGEVVTDNGYSSPYGGMVAANSGLIEFCYNMKNVGASGDSNRYVGGIAGKQTSTGTVTNCYNIGAVYGDSAVRAGIIADNKGIIKNSYYIRKLNNNIQLSSSTGTVENSGEKTEEEMKNDAFLNDLNADSSDENKVFVKDINNINEGYPILKWQITE